MAKEKREWELPHFKESHQMQGVEDDFWSVKFYPYTEPGLDPVFAFVGGNQIYVCRPPQKESARMDVLQLLIEEDDGVNNYTCAWSKNLDTGAPLLCVSGADGKIKIFDVLTGTCERVLAGHGGSVNDLSVSPINPYILASASQDTTIRIWSLDPAHEEFPCAAILEGIDGHREPVLTLAWHGTGRYLLSGGEDHVINLWVLPEFPDEHTGTPRPTHIFYPHFSTSEIHTDIVDCVCFYNDLILSKSALENCIVLWGITSFSSKDPPPPTSSAPTAHDSTLLTRSAFSTNQENIIPLYTRHLQLSIPDGHIIWMRFSLSPCPSPSHHPILAFCNISSKVYFWDLDRFVSYHDDIDSFPGGPSAEPGAPAPAPIAPGIGTRQHAFLVPFQHRNRVGALARIATASSGRQTSPASSTTSSHVTDSNETGSGGVGKVDWKKSRERWMKQYDITEPLRDVEAHAAEMVKGFAFTGRQVAWSNDGEWCVVVGSSGTVGLLQRWGKTGAV